MMKSMELLAPAGGAEALRAAVQSGADAVYIGGPDFGARHGAKNFPLEEMKECADYCHLYGVDVYVTVNTLVKERELDALADYAHSLSDIGADALIIQDLGAAKLIHEILPDMKLHASTQMTVTSLEGVSFLEKMGFSRVVLARELSAEEIGYITKSAGIETEVFVHGAICMCYSGQCLMSSILGGRSGNRGRCAQPCRLPYSIVENDARTKESYLLSPKDMALIKDLEILRNTGVTSLKIEGRLKRAEYVSAVVGLYRKYLDYPAKVSDEDMEELRNAFSRSGFTDGYLKGRLGSSMMSCKNPGGSSGSFTKEAVQRASHDANLRKVPVRISGTLKTDEPILIRMEDNDGNSVTAKGTQKSQEAVNRPLDDERIRAQLLKLGQTPFSAVSAEAYSDEGITVPIKEINDTRRRAVQLLTEKRMSRPKGRKLPLSPVGSVVRRENEILLTAQVMTEEQARAAVKSGIRRIYAPLELAERIKNVSGETELITRASDIFKKQNIATEGVLVSSAAAASYYEGKRLYGDMRLNIYNSEAVKALPVMESVMLSPELNLGEIRSIAEHTEAALEVMGYGRLPLMIMKNCPLKAAGKCQHRKQIYSLRDRKNERFPVICGEDCNAVLLNSRPVYMADKIEDLKRLKINCIRLIFTVEKFLQCDKIISEYKSALYEGICVEPESNTFTRGHYYRGVE